MRIGTPPPRSTARTASSEAPADGRRRADRVGALAGWGLAILLVVMLCRVAQLQLAPGDRLLAHKQSRTTTRIEPPVRGDLLDRRSRSLAVTTFGWRIFVDPVNLKPQQLDTAIVGLARALAKPEEDVGQRLIWALEENTRREQVRQGQAPDASVRPASEQWLAELLSLGGLATDEHATGEIAAETSAPVTAPVEIDPITGLASSPISFGDVPASPPNLKPIRYLPFREVVDEAVAATVRGLKIRGIGLERVPVRELVGSDAVAALVGKVGTDANIGMEAKLDSRLAGTAGEVRYVRDSRSRPLWIEPGQVKLPVHGEDVRLSIDLEIQSMGLEELQRGIEESDAAGARLVAVIPSTGEILAMCDIVRELPNLKEYPWEDDPRAIRAAGGAAPQRRLPYMAPRPGAARYRTIAVDPTRSEHPGLAALMRNRCVEDIYEPGSTFKPFVWSTISELGLARIDEIIDTESGRWITPYGRKLNDVTKRDQMTWGEVLVNSSNIGMAKVVERLSHAQLHELVKRFGFGKPTGLGLSGEASGLVTPLKDWTIYSQTSYAIGHEVAVTPLQMVRGFSAFARTGQLAGTLPDLRLTAVSASEPGPQALLYRVLPPGIAELTRKTMQGVTEHMQDALAQTDRTKHQWKYTLFGKSGTAEIPLGKAPPGKRRPAGSTGYYDDQYNSSFIAAGPIEDPRLVVIVVIDDPGPDLVFAKPMPRHYGSRTAGPVVRRFMERALTYLGAPPSVQPDRQHPMNVAQADAEHE